MNDSDRIKLLEERLDRLSRGGGVVGFGAAAGLALWVVLILVAAFSLLA